MEQNIHALYERDQRVWDACAKTYEEQIVAGHPDVVAYEEFEEDLLDRILCFLSRNQDRKIHLFDVGCGSGRLHTRYGLRISEPHSRLAPPSSPGQQGLGTPDAALFDPLLAATLHSVGGLDFSAEMITLAKEKVVRAGMAHLLDQRLWFQQGSAFELEPAANDTFPVYIALCNTIGVMQGPAGAVRLFASMRRAVEAAGGIAIISAYRREAVASHALGNYESTMNVCGQPRWLTPATFAESSYTQVPREYKRAHDPDPTITVDVFNAAGALCKDGHLLRRDPEVVAETVATGHIRTHSDYESNWYGFDQFAEWIDAFWPAEKTIHLEGRRLDAIRAEPVQLAILDAGGRLRELVTRWGS